MHNQRCEKGAGRARDPGKKTVVGRRDRAFGCARSRTKSVRKENRRANRRVAQALNRVERSAKNEPLPIGDVDVDFLYQSRGTDFASRTEADPRSSQRKIAQAVRTQLNIVRRAAVPSVLEPSPGGSNEKGIS